VADHRHHLGNHVQDAEECANSKVAFDFFKWSLEKGQADASSLDYVPLPAALVSQIEAYWASDYKQ
jgi:phosphate transport system substrate-binding protein